MNEDFLAKLSDLLDNYFPKGKAKERGEAIVFMAMALPVFHDELVRVIGDDEKVTVEQNKQYSVGELLEQTRPIYIRNELRDEQRKRGGISNE